MKTSSVTNHPSEYTVRVSRLPGRDHAGQALQELCDGDRGELLPQTQEATLPPPGQDLLSRSLGGRGGAEGEALVFLSVTDRLHDEA